MDDHDIYIYIYIMLEKDKDTKACQNMYPIYCYKQMNC